MPSHFLPIEPNYVKKEPIVKKLNQLTCAGTCETFLPLTFVAIPKCHSRFQSYNEDKKEESLDFGQTVLQLASDLELLQ